MCSSLINNCLSIFFAVLLLMDACLVQLITLSVEGDNRKPAMELHLQHMQLHTYFIEGPKTHNNVSTN